MTATAEAVRRSPLTALVRPALLPWLALHGLVGAAVLLVVAVTGGDLPRAGAAPDPYGWWAWDAGWYRAIAADGYGGPEVGDVRFFPLLPLLGRLVGLLPLVSAGAGLVVVASAAALAYLALLARLAVVLSGSPEAGPRAAWAGALLPGAGVLVLPYSEGLAGALAVGFFLALHARSVPLVALTGVLSGLVRPTGVLLALPAAWVLLTDRQRRLVALVGGAAAPLGALGYLAWSQVAYGDATAPLTVQSRSGLRGGLLVNPVPGVLADDFGGLWPPLTLLAVLGAALLLLLAARALPVPYVLWSAVLLVLAVGSSDAHSLPRYAAAVFPLALGLALRGPTGRRWTLLLAACAVASGALVQTWAGGQVVP